jgi:hypothetical protein
LIATETEINRHHPNSLLYGFDAEKELVQKASEDEMNKHFLAVLRHQFNAEDFLLELGIGKSDIYQRPHDGTGEGNKLQIEVANGMALEYRIPRVDFKTIEPAILYHRENQYHHQMWNGPDPNDRTKPHPNALRNGEDGLYLGAIDTVCALSEHRLFNNGPKTYDEIEKIARAGPVHKAPYILRVIPEMKKIKRLNLEELTDIHNFRNIGLPKAAYEAIRYHMNQAIETMRREHGYFL